MTYKRLNLEHYSNWMKQMRGRFWQTKQQSNSHTNKYFYTQTVKTCVNTAYPIKMRKSVLTLVEHETFLRTS